MSAFFTNKWAVKKKFQEKQWLKNWPDCCLFRRGYRVNAQSRHYEYENEFEL